MVRTEIVNFTSANVQVQEGTKGVINVTHLPYVEPTKVHKVLVDPNATYKVYTIGPVSEQQSVSGQQSVSWQQKVEISSDYCSDNQIVYVRASKDGVKLFKDPVPRSAKMMEKPIHNKAAATIVLREEVTIDREVASSKVGKVKSGGKEKWKVDPRAHHRRYFVELENAEPGVTEVEIPKEKFNDKEKIVVTPGSSGSQKLVIT
ncbi:hypothetical protein CY35_16G051100 [Sphagnum magellanicum]|jgi:hypothetical protein|nr:hypothetical protein CY35_16G051100 [Sphagnum magellanicum]